MLFWGATAIILIYIAVNKANHWPKACHIPVRYVALFSLQLVVIQPFPLDLFTTTNNNNINISRKMANGEQGAATSLYISCMMTIGVLRMQTALLVVCFCRAGCRYTMVVLWGIVVPHIAHALFCDTVDCCRQRSRARMRHNDRSVFNHGEKRRKPVF